MRERATTIGRELGNMTCEKRLRELGLSQLENTRLRGDLITAISSLKGASKEDGLFSEVTSDRARSNGLKLHQGKFGLALGRLV